MDRELSFHSAGFFVAPGGNSHTIGGGVWKAIEGRTTVPGAYERRSTARNHSTTPSTKSGTDRRALALCQDDGFVRYSRKR